MKCSHPGTDPGTVCLIFSSETSSRSGLYQEKEKKKKLQSDHMKIKPMLQEPSWMFWTLEALSQYWSLELKIQILPFAVTWMDLEIITLNEVSQKEKDKYHMISFTGGIWNMTQTNLPVKQKQTHRHWEQTCSCQGRGGGGGRDWNFGISWCKRFYVEWINHKILWYSTGNYVQYSVINYNEKRIWMWNWGNLLCSIN